MRQDEPHIEIEIGAEALVNVGGKKVLARIIEICDDGRVRLCYTQKNVERIVVRRPAFLEKPETST